MQLDQGRAHPTLQSIPRSPRSVWLKLALALVILVFAQIGPAQAHRFDVVLAVALTGTEAEQGQKFLEGFMLATTERDAHANEESDGHLGGLDVYVNLINTQGDLMAGLGQSLQTSDIRIAVFANASDEARVISLVEANNMAQLLPAGVDFAARDPEGYLAFETAFLQAYGETATPEAARGYNAARRVDLAVREEGSANDASALGELFSQSMSGISWLR